GTPLAAGILCALSEARRAANPALVVLITDGKPNVSSTGEPVWEELERVAAAAREPKAAMVVIDTSGGHPAVEKLAAMFGAPRLPLPRMNANGFYQRVAEAVSAMR